LEQTPPGKKSYRFYRSCKFRKFRRFYIYRTGDLARWLPDGNIELIGRNNDVSEIEYPLRQHNDIHEVLIIKPTQSSHFSAGDVPPGDRHLAYLISEKPLDIPALNRYISAKASRLYPLEFIKVTRLPLTANFKIDRKQWLGPPTEATPRIIPPRNSLERKLVKLWAKVLEIEESRISIDANFLELNGNSLKTIMLISEIFKEFEVRIPLAEVFNAPTITGLASYIKNASGSAYFSLEPVETREYYLLSSAQQRLFFIQEMDPANIGYNLSQTTPLDFAVDIDKIRETFKKIIKRHEILATSFHLIENKPVQRIHREIDFQVELQEAKTGIKEIINGFIRPFNLEQAPLLRMGLIKLAAEKYVLLLDIHHIVTDATSGTILVQDFFALYNGEQPAPLKIHYKDYAVWQHSEDCRQEIKRQEAFWLEKFAGDIPVLKLPLDYPRPTEQSFTGDMLMFTLGPQTATRTKALAKQENTTLFMLFLSIYYLFLAKITGQTDIVIGTGTAGRLHPDLENTMGIFINLIALRLTSNDHLTFREFLREITQSALADFENQEYQFDRLVDQVVKNKDRSRNPLFDVGFTFNTRDFSSAYVSRLGAGEYENEIKTAKFDLTLTGEEGEDDLYFFFEYCTDLFKKSKIQRFADYFRDIVNGVTIDSDIRLDRIDIVSHGLSGLETDISREVEGDFEL
jgi:acyl carrier protein